MTGLWRSGPHSRHTVDIGTPEDGWSVMRKLVVGLRSAPGRTRGLMAVVVLAALALATGSRAVLDPQGDGPGDVGLQLAGTAADARWMVDHYGADAITETLPWDLAFILCWSPLLALVVLWAGQNYRTVSTRRLASPLALAALGAGALDMVEDVCLSLAVGNGVDEAWPFAAAAAWGKWLVIGLVGVFAAGGLVSLLLRRDVRAVLREADEGPMAPASRTTTESRFGLAFSGGGVRAASITLGALQTLERDGAMGWGSADHVTSVSGGSYMAGAWSVARSVPGPPASPSTPAPWAAGGIQPGPEERHLRANLGYLLSNSPRGAGRDTIGQPAEPEQASRGGRLPAVVATVLTGMLVNALVFLGMLWVLSQLLGWFYRWYFGLACASWREDRALDYPDDHGCLSAPERLGTPILLWLALGLAAVLVWVVAAKASEALGSNDVPAGSRSPSSSATAASRSPPPWASSSVCCRCSSTCSGGRSRPTACSPTWSRWPGRWVRPRPCSACCASRWPRSRRTSAACCSPCSCCF